MKAIRVHQTGGPEVLQAALKTLPTRLRVPATPSSRLMPRESISSTSTSAPDFTRPTCPLRTGRKEPAWSAQWDRMSASSNPATA